MKENQIKKIFLVDDHPLVREGLNHLLTAAGFLVAGQAEDVSSIFLHPNFESSEVVIVDLSLGESNGLKLVEQLQQMQRLVVVYSMHENSNIIKQAFAAGAKGYVTKRESPTILLEAIRCVLAGENYQSPHVKKALADFDPMNDLSEQQKQIFNLLGRGMPNGSIAQELNIGVRTLESYCVRIMNKLNIDGIKQLRQQAILAYQKNNFDPSTEDQK